MNPYLASFLAISLDYGSTKYALSQGAIEANPFMHRHLEIKKSCQILATGYGLQLLERRNNKVAKWTKIGLFVINGMIAVHNIRQGMKAE